MPKLPMAKKLSTVAGNHLLLEGCVFLRNVIIARLLGAESLGEFIFLILAIRLFAMSTDLATERYILQVDQNRLKAALAGSHAIAQIRGLFLAAMLLLMGLHNVHNISFACYAFLAGSALIRGFTHQGYRLKQRTLNFTPALYVEGSTMLLGTFAIFTSISVVPSLEIVCACMLAQAGMHTALSHIFSGESYKAAAHKETFVDMVKFGFPLLLTSLTMFWSMQGERVILSSIMSSSEFAHFSMLFQLALVPALLIGRIALTLGLPILVLAKENWNNFSSRVTAFQVAAYGIMFVFFMSFVILVNPTLTMLFGADFKAEMMIIILVGLAQSIRLCRTPVSIAAQALGQTDIPLKANIIRVVASVLGAFFIYTGGSLQMLLATACVGEILACVVQSILFTARNRVPTQKFARRASTIKSNLREAN
ncbi:oligosaccharide flippase family protein [Kordiimonas laminariae]|uniref:oligosaccharide flippase family protein n=1 Tax=Kordiimonas laminariae TaxID=2917717 RepID=UPI001FF2ABF7|nr:oligosaccharide flippase family protein [Kordiimonas laminariae]MCK0067844.1 oligosaccharide flippase family protein [Kordiimonas laminariae]